MQSFKIISTIIILVGMSFFQSLYGSFEIYGRSMAKSGLTNTFPSEHTIIESISSNTISIDLNSPSYRHKRALNIKNIPSYPVYRVEFYIDGVLVSEDFSEPYMLYENASWLPSDGMYSIIAKHYNSSGTQISQEAIEVNISEPLSHRKRQVFLSTGIPNQRVLIKMKKHDYIFGSQTVESWTLNDTDPDDPTAEQRKPYPIRISGTQLDGTPLPSNSFEMQLTDKYREIFLQNFNFSVAGNVMKWYSNGESGTDFISADRWHQWHKDNNIPVRGHTILWGRGQEYESNSREMHDRESVEDLMEADNFEEAKERIKTRIQGIVNHYKGEIDEWDFNNELWNFDKYRLEFDNSNVRYNNAGKPFMRYNNHSGSGNSILSTFMQWAREANPEIRLFHNDYNIITTNNTSNAESYKNFILDLKENHGVDIDGIGVQGHFGSYRSKEHITECFNILDDLGLPIKVTEFDAGNDSMSPSTRANLLENLYRASFEHQSVEGVIMWGFWSGCHWRRAKAPWQYIGYERNDYNLEDDKPLEWVETPQVERYQDLVFGEWWTDTELVTDENGNINFSAFAGDYDIIIGSSIDSKTYAQSILPNSGGDTLYLETSGQDLIQTSGEVKIINPNAGSIFAINAPVEVRASYPDGSSVGVNSVEFYINDDLYKLDSVAPFNTTLYNLAEGNHTLSIVVNGNSSYEDEVSISVNSTSGPGPNIISNSGFESVTIDSQLDSFGSTIISSSYDYSANGSKSLLVDRTTSPIWAGLKYNLANLEEGETYIFSSKVYLEEDSQRIGLTTKKQETNYYTWPAEINNPQAGTWIELSGQFHYENELMDIIYIGGVDAGVNFYVDDISISKAGGPLVNPEDTDGDGMLDSWEQQFLVPLGLSDITELMPNLDSDSDGLTNIEEFRSGTLPFTSISLFEVSDVIHNGSNFECKWSGSSSKEYRVLSTTDLNSGQWIIEEEAIIGSPSSLNTWVDETPSSEKRFYKIQIDN